MTDLFNEREPDRFLSRDPWSTCYQSSEGQSSPCCNPKDGSWNKGKMLISAVIIMAAIGVGANSFVRVTSAQSGKASPIRSFSATLGEKPTPPKGDFDKADLRSQGEIISFNRPLDSLQALDALASDRDVAFILLLGDGQDLPPVVSKQIETALNKLWSSGQKIGAFTLKSDVPDYSHVVRHFAVHSFPCVLVLGRQGTASAVSGDISEARLYNAFILASKPASCCPTTGTASCCPK